MTKVEIQVAGHCVTVEGTESLKEVTDTALEIFKQTKLTARNGITVGFSSNNTLMHVNDRQLEL